MTDQGSPFLRRLRREDVVFIYQAFASNIDMQRQGDVTSLEDAERYVARMLSGGSVQLPWAICIGDRLLGLVNIAVDEANRNRWFSYWMHAEVRGRGWTSRAAATAANWALDGGGLERLELGHRTNIPPRSLWPERPASSVKGPNVASLSSVAIASTSRRTVDFAPIRSRRPTYCGCLWNNVGLCWNSGYFRFNV